MFGRQMITKVKASEFLSPDLLPVHVGLRRLYMGYTCVWNDNDFVVIKIDLRNA